MILTWSRSPPRDRERANRTRPGSAGDDGTARPASVPLAAMLTRARLVGTALDDRLYPLPDAASRRT